MVNSRRKGKTGELDACKAIKECLGVDARRGVQYCGTPDSPDIVTSLEGVHFEVKRTEKVSLWEWIDQATKEAGDKIPVVLHRKSRREWVAVVPLKFLPQLAALLTEHREQPCNKPDAPLLICHGIS